ALAHPVDDPGLRCRGSGPGAALELEDLLLGPALQRRGGGARTPRRLADRDRLIRGGHGQTFTDRARVVRTPATELSDERRAAFDEVLVELLLDRLADLLGDLEHDLAIVGGLRAEAAEVDRLAGNQPPPSTHRTQ